MVGRVYILTTNTNDKDDGGYHEIHDIECLSSLTHLIAVVTRVIDDNKNFGDPEYPLRCVTVRCQKKDSADHINRSFPYGVYGYGGVDVTAEHDPDL